MAGKLEGKTCLITGALAGIGRASAELFATEGATVVLLGRGKERGEKAMTEIRAKVPGAKLDFIDCDLSSQASIRKAADAFKARHQQLHILFNQAGVYTDKPTKTVDGIETMFAVNHLGYFLLTNLLLDVVKASAPARILNGTGAIERFGKIQFDDLNFDKKWKPFKAVAQSKLGNMLFTAELARKTQGTGITVNAFHPGSVKTTFGQNQSGFMGLVMNLSRRWGTSPEDAAKAPLELVTNPALSNVSGEFFMVTKQTAPSKSARDPELAKKLWHVSAKLTGLPS